MRTAVNVFYWLMCLSLLTKARSTSCSLDLQACKFQFQSNMQAIHTANCNVIRPIVQTFEDCTQPYRAQCENLASWRDSRETVTRLISTCRFQKR